METQIAPSNGAARSAHTPPRPSPAAPPNPIRGASFDEVHEIVAARAARMRPDATVHVADLVFTTDGEVVVPSVGPHALTSLAKRQLASMVGIRWERWFQSASPEERAEELNRRLKRTPGERKLRAWADASGKTAGTIRAVLPSGYEPIDDLRIFESLRSNMGSLMGEYLFQRVEAAEETSQYAAVFREARSLRGDDLVPGWSLRTSEIGQAPLSIDDYWLRLVCMNGLMVAVGGKRSLYRRHRAIDDDHLGAAFVLALGRLPGRFERALELMGLAMDAAVEHPDVLVAETLAGIPRALVEETQRAALAEAPLTRFGLLNVITRIAHTTNTDPEVRFAMESAAGTLLAA
ncbi:MAG: DUF945 domain-containing protein [Sandaracinaceae bacterium]|nr:DUF945 domain-containing protein [Sandaracinaceae bacterium]